jgi:hypothetical protein
MFYHRRIDFFPDLSRRVMIDLPLQKSRHLQILLFPDRIHSSTSLLPKTGNKNPLS